MLTGTFARSIDDKLRIAIPKRLRESLGVSPTGILYITPGTDGSLALYTEDALARLAERLAAASPIERDVRAFGRLFYARAQAVEVDRQGRIRVPPELATLAGLAGETVLLGIQDHLELWAAQRWKAYLEEKLPHYDAIAEAAFGRR